MEADRQSAITAQNGGDARAGPDQPKSLNVTGFFTAAAPDRLIRA
jgi:hypothetical protein